MTRSSLWNIRSILRNPYLVAILGDMVDHSKPMKLLVIGGTSILSESISQLARIEEYQIETTSRGGKVCSYADTQHELDLSSVSSLEEFLRGISTHRYNRIIVLTGETSGIDVDANGTEEINAYYNTHLINTVYLIDQLLAKLETPGNLIYISSIAATNSSYDCHYSAVKAGVTAYIKSRSRFLSANQSSFSIAPSLIKDTKMYRGMSTNTVANHLVRNKGRLISPNEVAKYVWAQRPETTMAINGQLISVGNEY
jgi:NAD(P)-dependent dehydrogenase (short-subunit alcohol dehydrogenase family)